MRMMRPMSTEPQPGAESTSSTAGSETRPGESSSAKPKEDQERTAADDLAAGVDLMLRAARKALKNIEPTRIEELGKRAMRSVEHLDRRKVTEFGKKAAKNLDPRKIEEVAEDAGRELMSVIERVAERVEDMLGVRGPGSKRPSEAPPETTASGGGEKPKVRVDDGTN
jgi:hypothetical protein